MKAYVDANIFILAAYGTGEKGETARRIIGKIQSGEQNGVTCALTMDEVMWAVIKQKQGQQLIQVIEAIYQTPNLEIVSTNPNAPLQALNYMEEYGLKPRDAIHAAVMHEQGISTIYSDDPDFDSIKGIKRIF